MTKHFIFFSLFVVVLIAIVVTAEYPVQVYGTITQQGQNVKDGTSVSFLKGNLVLASTTIKDSRYGLETPIFIEGEELSLGDVITIEVNDKSVYDFTYLGGADIGIDLDIPLESTNSQNCVSDWQCSSWTDCVSGLQTRDCHDLNNCGTIENKPNFEKSCVNELSTVVSPPVIPGINSETVTEQDVTLKGFATVIYLVAALVIGLVIVAFVQNRRRNKYVPEQEPHRFVHVALKEGHPEHKILEWLLEKGWKKEHVENAIEVEKLRHYVISQLSRGVDKETLKNYLIQNGWKRDIVGKVLP